MTVLYKICVMTGTRAEYGILKLLLKKIDDSQDLELKLVVTGTHLSRDFGYTISEIEEDGFKVDSKIEMLLSSDTPAGVTKSMGVELFGFADYFDKNKPDIIVILGDRYEAFIAATAAMIFRIPIVHIHGGELTEGLIDEAIRHSITKMSTIHFAATEEYRKRIIQMGEQPDNVYNVGALGVENIKNLNLLSRETLIEKFGRTFEKDYCMVTFHPVTLENMTAGQQFEQLLGVIDKHSDINYVFTYANADPNGAIINQKINSFVQAHTNAIAFKSMGQLGYLSALNYCYMVVGNSSSGLAEAPSFKIPTINIGDRQRGRVKADSVIDCKADKASIEKAFKLAQSEKFRNKCKETINPYEKDGTSEIMINIIKNICETGIDIKKKFYDVEFTV